MPKNPVAVMSIVSSKLAEIIAADYNVEMRKVLTGFKFIGEQVFSLEQSGEVERFIFAFEESCGYLVGNYARDKDAVVASMLVAEMASYYKQKGKSLINVRDELYGKYGYYLHTVNSYSFEGSSGMAKMAEIMHEFRENPPKSVAASTVVKYQDYKTSKEILSDGTQKEISLPKSDVLTYELSNGDGFIIRPSGTEPKIKVYYTNIGKDYNTAKQKYSKISEIIGNLLEL
jgi:phosphoglucomutase